MTVAYRLTCWEIEDIALPQFCFADNILLKLKQKMKYTFLFQKVAATFESDLSLGRFVNFFI